MRINFFRRIFSPPIQIALFLLEDKTPLLVVTWGELEEPDFTHVTLFAEKDGKMIPADRKNLAVADSKDHEEPLKDRFFPSVQLIAQWLAYKEAAEKLQIVTP